MKYSGFYYNLFKGSMKKVIVKNYGIDYANNIMKKSKDLYKRIVKEAPDMGDGNPMSFNALFAYAFFSPYLASNKRIKKEVVRDMMREGLYHVKWFFSRTNLNKPKGKLKNSKAVRDYYKWYTPEKEKKYPESFKVDFEGIPYEGACYYRITKCPICSYARVLGCMELMPLFCELDSLMIHFQHGVLHREYTLAKGDSYCDYFITGDKELVPEKKEAKKTAEETTNEASTDEAIEEAEVRIEEAKATEDEALLNDLNSEEEKPLDLEGNNVEESSVKEEA